MINKPLDLNEIERQTDRAAEGQDTITPLTNTIFLRQLSKLKHQTTTLGVQQLSGSTKSINSIDSGGVSSPLEITAFPFDQDAQSNLSPNSKFLKINANSFCILT